MKKCDKIKKIKKFLIVHSNLLWWVTKHVIIIITLNNNNNQKAVLVDKALMVLIKIKVRIDHFYCMNKLKLNKKKKSSKRKIIRKKSMRNSKSNALFLLCFVRWSQELCPLRWWLLLQMQIKIIISNKRMVSYKKIK